MKRELMSCTPAVLARSWRHLRVLRCAAAVIVGCTVVGACATGTGRAGASGLARFFAASPGKAGVGSFGRRGPLTPHETEMARVAWKYFERNYQEGTGLVNAVEAYPSTTMWDTASYVGGMVAARELGIITKDTFDQRFVKLIGTLNSLSFFRDELPNKAYNAQTAEKVTYTNQPGEIGFSAIDLARMLVLLQTVKGRYPEHSNAIDHFVLRWKFCNAVKDGQLFGSAIGPDGKTQYLQEGRLGYEEYAAKAFQLWGFDPAKAAMPEPYDIVRIYGVDIPYDTRDPRQTGAHNYVVTESYVLDAIEFNWDLANDRTSDDDTHTDKVAADFARRIYEVQERRFRETGMVTARTEHQLDGDPYFVYDTIYSDGFPWNTITDTGKYVPQFAAVALKGALGLWAIWPGDYTDRLFDAVSGVYDPEKGFYEGVYENGRGPIKTFTSNNNGITLESLLHKAEGKILRWSGESGLWEKAMGDLAMQAQFGARDKCFPVQEPGE
jgi:hypothetical protein